MKKQSCIIALIVSLIISITSISFSKWVRISSPGSGDIRAFTVSNIYLFAGNDFNGVFRSTDNGESWSSAGLKDTSITSLTVNGTNLFAGSIFRGGGGVYLSTNNGDSWTKVGAGQVYDVSALITDSTNIYAAAYDGIYRSTNNGSNWTKLSDSPAPKSLIIGIKGLFAGTDYGVFYSPDKVDNWIHSNNGLTNTSISAFAVISDSIFVGTSTGVFFSTDLGAHWSQRITGLTNTRIHSFAIKGNNIFVGTEQGVFLSSNGGRQWAQINDGLPPNTVITTLFVSDSFLVAGADFNGGVWRHVLSEIKPPVQCDSLVDIFPLSIGNKWTYNYSLDSYDEISLSYKVRGAISFQIIRQSFASDSIIWIMQKSNDLNCNRNGTVSHDTSISTFNIMEINSRDHRVYSSGFPFSSVPFDSISVNRYTYVDTSGLWNFQIDKGRMQYIYIFKRDIGAISYFAMDMCTCLDYWYESYDLSNSHITGVETHREMNQIKEFRLQQNYPNPFNPSTTISFSLPSRSFVLLRVFDLIGREVATIISEDMQAGNYFRQWNATHMPSGVYFYRLQAGAYTETKKFVLLR